MTWAWRALVLHLVGLVLAFGVRTWLQLRRTGTSGFRGIPGHPGSLAWWGGVLFSAAVLLGMIATHGEQYHRYAAAAGRFLPGIGRMTTAVAFRSHAAPRPLPGDPGG